MKPSIKQYILPLLIAVCVAPGCAHSRNPFALLAPKDPKADNAALQAMLASQQPSAQQMQAGGESSLYPPSMVEHEHLPRTEKDLKNPLQLHLSYAKLQEQLGYLTEARSSYEKVVDSEPKSIEANIGLARLDALAGRYDDAEKRMRNATSIDSNSAEAHYALGNFLAEQKRHTEAIVEIQKAVKLQPSNTDYKYSLGIELAKLEQYQEAMITLTEVVSRPEAMYNIGYIAMNDHQDDLVAERYMVEALRLNPKLEQARYWVTELKNKKEPNGQQIITASASKPNASTQDMVIHAVSRQTSEEASKKTVVPASAPSGGKPEGLTPDQWEQWQNQTR
ncbi:MAG TPA: hypothetical protein DD473_10405 [Planctomycetaceae bacterium]|nr:hypothetical protein [Planctomycetaceae bacterium]